jgi:hypothetical protein
MGRWWGVAAAAVCVVVVVVACTGYGEEERQPATPLPDAGAGGEGGPGGCTPGARLCLGSELRVCDTNGTTSTTLEVCQNSVLCNLGIADGKCAAPVCNLGDVVCVGGNERHKCKEDRSGTEKIETCAAPTAVCNAGACAVCVDGARDCAGIVPRACVGGKWESQPPCLASASLTCWVGACVDARLPHYEMPNNADSAVRPIRYTVLSANVVRDEVTKLEWQRSISPTPIDIQSGKRVDYCLSLTLDGAGGFHLATGIELMTLMDYAKVTAPKLDTTAFLNTPTAGSAATAGIGLLAAETSSPHRINYDSGIIDPEPSVLGNSYPTRCVRAVVPAPAEPRFTLGAGGEEVTDNWTKLTWQKRQTGSYYTEGTALANYCVAPFRLPSAKELITLFDPRVQAPLPHIDTTLFSMDTDFLWSSTQRPGTTTRMRVDYVPGFATLGPGYDSRVRCVK